MRREALDAQIAAVVYALLREVTPELLLEYRRLCDSREATGMKA